MRRSNPPLAPSESLRTRDQALVGIWRIVSVPNTHEDLADTVLGLIRTRSDLNRWSAANEHGRADPDAIGPEPVERG
jgi:hypothetical protein